METKNTVNNMNEVNENTVNNPTGTTGVKPFLETMATYIVDSDAALASWANNDSRNNYTIVIIASGTWKTNKSINLTATKTKQIYADVGSVIEFSEGSSVNIGLYYESRNDANSNESWIQGLTVQAKGNMTVALRYCYNLYNCKVILGTGSVNNMSAYYYCYNLINCYAEVSLESQEWDYGFHNCENLTNCYGYWGNPFVNCKRLNGCIAETVEGHTPFYICQDLQNCKGTNPDNEAYYGCTGLINCEAIGSEGFSQSSYLQNCYANATVNGFFDCHFVTACRISSSGRGGFFACSHMLMNISNGRGYRECYVIEGGASVNATAAGGFNV